MKTVFAAIAVLISSIVLSQTSSATSNPPGCEFGTSTATSCIATFNGPFVVSAFIPCLNRGTGETVTFTSLPQQPIFFTYSVTNGSRNGALFSVGGGMHGTGQTTRTRYTAQGSTQQGFTDWIPFNPDGSANGDGVFSYSDNYYITGGHAHSAVKVVWHRTQRFAITNNGVNFSFQPDEVVCR